MFTTAEMWHIWWRTIRNPAILAVILQEFTYMRPVGLRTSMFFKTLQLSGFGTSLVVSSKTRANTNLGGW